MLANESLRSVILDSTFDWDYRHEWYDWPDAAGVALASALEANVTGNDMPERVGFAFTLDARGVLSRSM